MIRYISSFSVKTLHGMVNAGLLRMLALVRRPEQICVEATTSSIDMLREALPPAAADIAFRKLRVNAAPGRWALLLRYLQSAVYNVAALMRSHMGDTLIYNFNNVFSLAAVNYLARRFFKNRSIVVVCHGEMEYLANAAKHNRAYKKLMIALTCRFFLRTRPEKLAKGISFVVLGDVIKDNLRQYLPEHIYARFHSIDHPVIPDSSPGSSSVEPHTGLHLGTVGIMNGYKGADAYLRLIEQVKARRHDIEFSIAGQVQSNIDAFRRLGTVLADDPIETLPDSEFRRMVDRLDYILLLYPADHYRLIASGALLDTVRFRRPLIGIGTAYFRYFFEKFGPVGYLVDDEAEMERIVAELHPGERPQFDYDAILARLTPEALAPEFDSVLHNCAPICLPD